MSLNENNMAEAIRVRLLTASVVITSKFQGLSGDRVLVRQKHARSSIVSPDLSLATYVNRYAQR